MLFPRTAKRQSFQWVGLEKSLTVELCKKRLHNRAEMKGFSPRNLKYMRAFAEVWPDLEIVQQLVAQIPWGHLVRILDKTSTLDVEKMALTAITCPSNGCGSPCPGTPP